jgi:hypothetical protein
MSQTLYDLVKAFDAIVGENPKGKPVHTIEIFTRVLYDTRQLSKNGKNQANKPKNQPKKEKSPEKQKRKLNKLEFNTLVTQIIEKDKEEKDLPTYEQCQNKQITVGQEPIIC